jgi:hypothetical protein
MQNKVIKNYNIGLFTMSGNTLDGVYGGMSAEDASWLALELGLEGWELGEPSLPQGQTGGDSPPSQTGEDSPPSQPRPTRRQMARQRRLLSGVQRQTAAEKRAEKARQRQEAKQAAAEARRQLVETTQLPRKPKPSRYIPEGYMCQICRMGQESEKEMGVPRKLRCRCRKEIVWHFGCINTWLMRTGKCPLCKDDVSPFTQS